jgi:hypothetical protein
MDPCRGVLELPAPRPKVCKVEKESTGLVPELGIPYENGGPVALWVKGAVATAIDGLGPLLEVEAVETMVARTDDGGLGGRIPPVVTTVVGILGFPEEETTFVSITACALKVSKGPLTEVGQVWFPVTRSLQTTLVGPVFALEVAGVAPV